MENEARLSARSRMLTGFFLANVVIALVAIFVLLNRED